MVTPTEQKLMNLVLAKVYHDASGGISTENVFVSDFGIRHWFGRYNRQTRDMMKVPGTESYVAPEVFREGETALTPAADIWAVGCIGFELFTGTRLFETEAMVDHYVETGYIPDRQIQLNQLYKLKKIHGVLSGCMVSDPSKRSTIGNLFDQLVAEGPVTQ
jgi:serine/threonine protein kinase